MATRRIWRILVCLAALAPSSLRSGLAQAEQPPAGEAVAFALRDLYARALGEQGGVPFLRGLAEGIGARPAGSPAYARAVDYAADTLAALGLAVRRQPVAIARPWSGAGVAAATAYLPDGRRPLRVLALGGSRAAAPGAITAPLVELHSLDEADSVGAAGGLAGAIAFYNRPVDPARVNTFDAYGGAVDQRVYGPARAAAHGAVGALVRSMTPNLDRLPHTGITVFPDTAAAIPALAVSTLDAEALARALDAADGVPVEVSLSGPGRYGAPATDHNVLADWRGAVAPDSVILVGAHLDSWHVGQGAHDDGAGVAHVVEAVRLLRSAGYAPRHTIRVALFANEEGGVDGGRAYWDLTDEEGVAHVAAIESDRGGFTPRGFTVDAPAERAAAVAAFTARARPLLEPYGVSFRKGGGGADIAGLRERGAVLFGLDVDAQRYFDLHHTERDVLAAVHPREFELGAAGIAALVMLLDAGL